MVALISITFHSHKKITITIHPKFAVKYEKALSQNLGAQMIRTLTIKLNLCNPAKVAYWFYLAVS